MKFFLMLFVFSASQAFAANLNLNGGESAVIQANVSTLVSCGGNAVVTDCASKAASLKGLLDKCTQSLNTQWCIENTWPKWKASNSTCVSEGSQVCVDKCTKAINTQWCISNCQ